jgi:hypothetical protein
MKKIKFYPFSDKTEAFAPAPTPAGRMVPEWYKKQPGSVNEAEGLAMGQSNGTVKRCMPVFDVMTSGYLVLMPCDLYIDTTNPEKIEWSVPQAMTMFSRDMITTHHPDQYSHYPIDYDVYHKDLFRIMPFWSAKTDPGYSAIFTNPFHRDLSPFFAISGFVDTDNFISDGHFSFLVKKNFKGVIKQGTPIVQIIPVQREDWYMEMVDPKTSNEEVFNQRLSLRSVFRNAYKEKMRVKKEYK